MSWLPSALWLWFDRRRGRPDVVKLEELETRTEEIVRRLHALGIDVEVIRREVR
jgi:hypothetical protein